MHQQAADAAPVPAGPSSHAARFAKLLDALQASGEADSPLAAAHLEAEKPAESIEQSARGRWCAVRYFAVVVTYGYVEHL